MARRSRSVDALIIALAIAGRIAGVWVLQSHRVPRSTYEHGEIASLLDVTVGTSKSQLHKARMRLRELLTKR